jgi:hypothetical protein
MSGVWASIGTMALLWVVSGLFGEPVAFWLSSVLLAFCLGAFWGHANTKRPAAPVAQEKEGG